MSWQTAFEGWKKAGRYAERTIDDIRVEIPPEYFDYPTDWNLSRVVKLNAANMTAHLFAARIAFKTLPGAIDDELKKVAQKGGSWLAGLQSFALASSLLTWLTRIANFVVSYYDAIALENKIRRAALDAKRELVAQTLNANRGGRRYQHVSSRRPGTLHKPRRKKKRRTK